MTFVVNYYYIHTYVHINMCYYDIFRNPFNDSSIFFMMQQQDGQCNNYVIIYPCVISNLYEHIFVCNYSGPLLTQTN